MTDPTRKRRSHGNLLDRLRAKSSEKNNQSHQSIVTFNTHPFGETQLGWLEEYPDYWVDILALPEGSVFDPEHCKERIQIKEIPEYIIRHSTQNIWRSWILWKDYEKKEEVGPIPFWLDIDDEAENLENAKIVTQTCVELLIENAEWAGDSDRIRIGFSGKKGFHVYIKPPVPLSGNIVKNDLVDKVRTKLHLDEPNFLCQNRFFESTVIDVFHDDIRVMGSIHSWINENDQVIARRTFQMTVKEFYDISIEEILLKSLPY